MMICVYAANLPRMSLVDSLSAWTNSRTPTHSTAVVSFTILYSHHLDFGISLVLELKKLLLRLL